ncbi:hypothetical protein ACYBSK_23325 [Streptomyces sp. BYX5S]
MLVVGVLLGLTGALVGVGFLLTNQDHGAAPPAGNAPTSSAAASAPPSGKPDQAVFRDDVAADRRSLLAGVISCRQRLSADVGDSVVFGVRLRAVPASAVADSAPPTGAVKRWAFPVGGVQGASLTATSRHVEVRSLGDSKAEQVIAETGDTAFWEWAVAADRPGVYALKLGMTTFRGTSDQALAALNPPLTIRFEAHNTVSHSVSWLRAEVVAWGGVAVALVALLAFRTPLLTFVRGRREARRERHDRGRDGYI